MRYLAMSMYAIVVICAVGCGKNDAANLEALRAEIAKTEAAKAEAAKAEEAKAEAEKKATAADQRAADVRRELVEARAALTKAKEELKTIRDVNELAKKQAKDRAEAFLQAIVAIPNTGSDFVEPPQVGLSLKQAVAMMTTTCTESFAAMAKDAKLPKVLENLKGVTYPELALYNYLKEAPMQSFRIAVHSLNPILAQVDNVQVEPDNTRATASAKFTKKGSSETLAVTIDLEKSPVNKAGVSTWQVSRFRIDLPQK